MGFETNGRVARFGAAAAVVFVGLLFGVGEAHAHGEGPSEVCFPVRATIEARFVDTCDSPVGLCTEGRVRSSFGYFSGTSRFVATGLGGEPVGEESIVTPAAEPATTWSYSGVLTIDTALGSLTFDDVGVLDTVAGTFTELERPVSGTGNFEGVTGSLFISGHVTEDGSGFDGNISGELCIPVDY